MIDVALQKGKKIIPGNITHEQARDTGMAMVLICLLIGVFLRNYSFFTIAIPLHILNMVWPSAYRPLAWLWIGFSQLMGTVLSTIILTIIFFLLVTPVGLLRRLCGADPLQLKGWKKDRSSVFRVRQDKYRPEDIESPY